MENKIISGSGAQVSESGFISKVFLWMSFGLVLSTLSSFALLSQPQILRVVLGNQWAFIGICVAEIALVIWLSARIFSMSAVLASSIFCVYSILNGVTVSAILLVYTGASVMQTFAITAGTFFFFSLYGLTTKKDLTSMGGLAVMVLIGAILASVVNFFLHSPVLMWVITYVCIAVFVVLIAYDTQKLKSIYAMGFESAEAEKKYVIMGALALYLDFINLFMLLLRLFGRRRD